MFSDPKYKFSVHQKYFFVVQSKFSIFHRIQPTDILLLLQLSADKMVNVLTGPLFTIISLSLSFSTALFFPPVKREDPIHFLTKPWAETRIASQCQRSAARAGRGAATTPPTATAGVYMEAGAASSPPALGPRTARTAGTPARSMSWRRSKLAAKNSVQMLTLTLKSCCVTSAFKEILMVAMRLNVWRCLAPPAGPAPHR